MTKQEKQKMSRWLYNTAPMNYEKKVDRMTKREREDLRRMMEGIAEKAAFLAGYLDMRHGAGCGDQGHTSAVKRANRNGRITWMKAFGYNAYINMEI